MYTPSQVQGPVGVTQPMATPGQIQMPFGVEKSMATSMQTPGRAMQSMSAPVHTQVPYGILQPTTVPAQTQVPLGASMAMPTPALMQTTSMPSQTLVPLRAAQSTTTPAIEYQTIQALTDVLNSIMGTQQPMLASCQQQTAQSSLSNMPDLSPNISVISQSNEKPTRAVTAGDEQSYMTRAMPGQTGEMPTQSTVVNPETGMSGASLPTVNQAAEFNDEKSLPTSDAEEEEESENPLDYGVGQGEEEEYVPEYVPTPKGAFRQIKKTYEAEVRSESKNTERSEDVLEQLLPDDNEDMTIKSPFKRGAEGSEDSRMNIKRQKKDQNVKVDLPVEINKLGERTLVTVEDTFCKVMERNVSAVKAVGEMMKENVYMYGKMIYAMTRLRHTMEDRERERCTEARGQKERRQKEQKVGRTF